MKLRTDFVTNSSSSNVILALKEPLSFKGLYRILLDLKALHPTAWGHLPFEDVMGDAESLTARACGQALDNMVEYRRKMGIFWDAYFRQQSPEAVDYDIESVNGDSKIEDVEEESDSFYGRGRHLQKEGFPFVYMFDVDDFGVYGKDFEARLRNWGYSGDKQSRFSGERCLETNTFVLWVISYY